MMECLFVNLFESKRSAEFEECLDKNKKVFDKIVVLAEKDYEGVVNIRFKGIPTFSDFFKAIEEHGEDVNVIANSDIYFENILNPGENTVYALSRWEGREFFCREDSADAWIFRGIPQIRDCNFRLGLRGTDNAIAERFERVGYKVLNPSFDIKIQHLHKERIPNNNYAPMPYQMRVPPFSLRHDSIFITSINPYDRMREQITAVQTWNGIVVSLNTQKEIEKLSEIHELNKVVFIRAGKDDVKGKYIRLDFVFKTMRRMGFKRYILLNSDIEIHGFKLSDDLVIGIRNDIKNGKKTLFPYGYDVFCLKDEDLKLFNEKTDYAIDLPWWDFYVPLKLIQNNVRIKVDKKHFFHRWHETRYDYGIWHNMGEQSRKKSCFIHRELGVQSFCIENKKYIESRS